MTTTMPDTKGMIGRCPRMIFETTSEVTVAAMKRAVATNSGPPSSDRAGNLSTSQAPRRLAKKKISSGPSSSASFSIG